MQALDRSDVRSDRRPTYLLAALATALLTASAALLAAPSLARLGFGMSAGPLPPAMLPACELADRPASRTAYDQWADTLLDTAHRLPAWYMPPDLEPFRHDRRTITLRSFVHPELEALLSAASADGVEIRLTSGYRSYQRQAAVYQQLREERGKAYARLSAARAGHSEHQLGTAVDLEGGAEWLAANAWRFGFVQSYPLGRSPAWSCYKPESWHYRYFGRERAAEMRESGYSPREWLWLNIRSG